MALVVLEWAEKRQVGTGNATSLKIGQGHLWAMPVLQKVGTGIFRHLLAIRAGGHFRAWALPCPNTTTLE